MCPSRCTDIRVSLSLSISISFSIHRISTCNKFSSAACFALSPSLSISSLVTLNFNIICLPKPFLFGSISFSPFCFLVTIFCRSLVAFVFAVDTKCRRALEMYLTRWAQKLDVSVFVILVEISYENWLFISCKSNSTQNVVQIMLCDGQNGCMQMQWIFLPSVRYSALKICCSLEHIRLFT